MNKETYDSDGFVLLKEVASSQVIPYQARIQAAIKEMAHSIGVDEDEYLGAVSRWDLPCKIVEELKNEVVTYLEPYVTEILKSEVEPVRASIIQKSMVAGRGTHGHQDSGYWLVNGSKTYDTTTWIALDDIDETNGALIVLPKSHINGPEAQDDFLSEGFYDPSKDWGEDGKTLKMKAGDVVVFSPDLWHASHSCTSHKRRTALVIRWQTVPSRRDIFRNNLPLSEVNKSTFGMKTSSKLLKEALQYFVRQSKFKPSSDLIDLIDTVVDGTLLNGLPDPEKSYITLNKIKILTKAQSHGGNDLGNGVWQDVRDYIVIPYQDQIRMLSGNAAK